MKSNLVLTTCCFCLFLQCLCAQDFLRQELEKAGKPLHLTPGRFLLKVSEAPRLFGFLAIRGDL